MARDNSFAEYIAKDILGHIHGITIKGMFDGYGVYLNGIIIGLIIDNNFYLKVDKEMINKYKEEGGKLFNYERKSKDGKNLKIIELSYMSIPADVLENREEMKNRIFESYEMNIKNANLYDKH